MTELQKMIYFGIGHEKLAILVADMAVAMRIDIPSRPETVDMFLARMGSMAQVIDMQAEALRAAQDAHTKLMRCRV